MVSKVKRSESAVIRDPLTVCRDQTIGEVKRVMSAEGFSGFPVVDSEGVLLGMITGRDVRHYCEDDFLVGDVMTPREKLVTGPPDTTLEDARRFLYENRIEKLPLVDDNGKLAGLITGADIEKHITFTNAAAICRMSSSVKVG